MISLIYFSILTAMILIGCHQDWLMNPTQPKMLPLNRGLQEAIFFEMPYLVICDYLTSPSERRKCSDINMLRGIISNIRIPADAHNCDLTARVQISFIVSAEGEMVDLSINKEVCSTLEAALIEVLHKLPAFVPANRNGKNVPFQFRFPLNIHWE